MSYKKRYKKPKIIGLIPLFASGMWTKPIIEHALSICDEVIVNYGPYCPELKEYEDGSKDICMEYKDRIKIVTSMLGKSQADSMAPSLNLSLEKSKYFKKGNWVWFFSSDEFYSNKAINETKKAINSNLYDRVIIPDRTFFINTKKHFINKGGDHNRIVKITDKKRLFAPTCRWTGAYSNAYVSKNLGTFHYRLLTDLRLKITQKDTQGLTHLAYTDFQLWVEKIYFRYHLYMEKYWIEKNKKLFNRLNFWNSAWDDYRAKADGILYTYNGKHPDIIEEYGFTEIDDFRKIYKR